MYLVFVISDDGIECNWLMCSYLRWSTKKNRKKYGPKMSYVNKSLMNLTKLRKLSKQFLYQNKNIEFWVHWMDLKSMNITKCFLFFFLFSFLKFEHTQIIPHMYDICQNESWADCYWCHHKTVNIRRSPVWIWNIEKYIIFSKKQWAVLCSS